LNLHKDTLKQRNFLLDTHATDPSILTHIKNGSDLKESRKYAGRGLPGWLKNTTAPKAQEINEGKGGGVTSCQTKEKKTASGIGCFERDVEERKDILDTRTRPSQTLEKNSLHHSGHRQKKKRSVTKSRE